jgi:hypothetical protein
MAGEIAFDFAQGQDCYVQIRNRTSGYIWNGTAFETYSQLSGNLASYPVAVTEQGSSAHYVGNFPAAIPAGVYDVTAKTKVQVPYLEGDRVVAAGEIQWNGSAVVPLADLATSGQIGQIGPIRISRGTMVRNFPFKLVSSLDHITPFTSGVCSGQISRDGAAFGALQSGAFSEIGLGWYSLQALTSGDLLANTVALAISARGISGGTADQRDFSFVTQRTSGQ